MIPVSLGVAAMLASFASLGTCLCILYTRSWHESLTVDSTFGVQKFHTAPTPRIGGLAIFAGMAVTLAVVPRSAAMLLLLMLVSAVPAFGSGLTEDLTKKVGVLGRLVATLASGVLAWGLTGAVIQRTGLPALDTLFVFLPLAVLSTAFCVGGMANAVNIIDGFNGLAGGVVVVMLAALGFIAGQVGDTDLALICVLISASIIGFLVVNWPLGKMFLGDGGAYLLGFLVGLVAVLLVGRNPQVSPWAPLMVCAYPVIEVAFSVYRKSRRKGSSPSQPDGVHMHMLLHRRVVKARMVGWHPCLQNAMTSPFAWIYTGMTATWATLFYADPAMLIFGFALAALAYSRVYTRIAKFRWWPAPTRTREPDFKRGPLEVALMGPLAAAPARAVRLVPAVARLRARTAAHFARAASVEPVSATSRLLYTVLGASSCVAFIEPSPFEVLALLLMLGHAARGLQSSWWRMAGPLTATMLAVLGVFVVLQLVPVALQAQSSANSAFYAGVTTMLILIAVHLGRLHGSGDGRFTAFLAGYAGAALLSSLLALATLHPALNLMPDLLQLAGRPKALFKDPNVLGPFLVPATVVFIELAGRAKGAKTALFALCAAVCVAGVIASGSRAAWINQAIVLAIYAALSSRRQLAVLAYMAVFAAVPAGVFLLGDGAQETLQFYTSRFQYQDYDNDRFAMTQAAIELGLRYPAGVGPGEVASYLGMGLGMDPHNTYVRIWAENGPVALGLFSVFLLLLMAHALQECMGRRMQPAFICAFAVLAGALVNSGVVDTLHWRHFWIILAVCVFSFNPRGEPSGLRYRPLRVRV